ncbi:MAG: PEP/pyruvate-binding domain-containing protein [Clostridium sp.]|jgi:hypothetical protein|nr:PEP/pyruvate-binding domain-containing protein [Clostridium sp.]
MGAFDKISSGNTSLDIALDSIRMGDNVVWQVSELEEFRFFVEPFVRQAVTDGRSLNYIRFAQHKPLLPPAPWLKIHQFDPDLGFEAFTVAIYQRIREEGRDAFYVFDCLSDLQSAWYTDMMMGNFFRVTCPYLFQLDTVAYFPLLRGKHSFDAVAKIRDTTQLLLDIHSTADAIYLHPLKVWNRYSNRMFLPHSGRRRENRLFEFKPLEGGVAMSRYYQLLEETSASDQDQNYDSHDRFFTAAKLENSKGNFSEETENLILESTMTKDRRMQELLKQFFTPGDYFALRDRMIGSGAIGGKACGMLLARKIIDKRLPEYAARHREIHDSFYIASDVFYTYIVENNCWNIRVAQRTEEGYFSCSQQLKSALLSGSFPSQVREQFRSLLQHFGQSPIIVRSSSFLEDGFGNAFAGKYESVFCVNQGTPEERLLSFEQAVREVYASIMDVSALEYRQRRGLQKKDEQMAVLVQRVSGTYFGKYFMPAVAGVGYSHSAYKWRPDMDPAAGMLRIVIGLGTRAVDRTENDYPRLVNLDRPDATMLTTTAQKHRFSQRKIDVLDEESNTLRTISLEDLLPLLPRWYQKMVLEHDCEAENILRQRGRFTEVWFVSCQKLLENQAFTGLIQSILKTLEAVYGNPVDIEYTLNLDEQGDFVINLLQCRPLYTGGHQGRLEIPALPEKDIFFRTKDSSMGSSGKRPIDVVVQVDPKAYYEYPHSLKPRVAQAVGGISRRYKESGKQVLLMAPGRIGTSSPELGIPVRFAEISGFCGICEISDNRAGYLPDLSYGSHMFQDLVEAEIVYGAIWNNEKTLRYAPDFFRALPNLFSRIVPESPELEGMFHVTEPRGLTLWLDSVSGEAVCGYGE